MSNLGNINNNDNLERGENLLIQAQTTARLIEINKTITDAVNEFNMVMNASNNVDYKSNSANNTENSKSEKIETVADKIDEYKNETVSNKVDIDNITNESTEENTESKKIDINNIVSETKDQTPKIDVDNITNEPTKESSKTEEELAQELDAKKLLNEANKLEEKSKPVNNENYEGSEKNKKTGTDGPSIDISHII